MIRLVVLSHVLLMLLIRTTQRFHHLGVQLNGRTQFGHQKEFHILQNLLIVVVKDSDVLHGGMTKALSVFEGANGEQERLCVAAEW